MEALRTNRGAATVATLVVGVTGFVIAGLTGLRGSSETAKAGVLPPCLMEAPPDATANALNPTDPESRRSSSSATTGKGRRT
jgi:hypothetical protein